MSHPRKRWGIGAAVILAAALLPGTAAAVSAASPTSHAAAASQAAAPAKNKHQSPDSGSEVYHDLSPTLAAMAAASGPAHGDRVAPDQDTPLPHPRSGRPDPVVQSTPGTQNPNVSLTNNWDAIGSSTGYSVTGVPPDPNAAVGTTQVVEVVNTAYAVYSKTGSTIIGATNTSSFWSGFGGFCQSANDGDATVAFDRLANRWVVQQFANVTSSSGPYYECVAVSTSADATGTYNRYSFQFSNFPDYPKLSVWPDAYYTTYNMFTPAGSFIDAEICAMNRSAMLTGATATQQCFTTDANHGGILAGDVDGTTAPPSGENETVVGLGTTSTTLSTWKFHVDWATPANSSFTGPTDLTVASYTTACGTSGTCIPQSGTTQQLDSLSDRIMYRLAYRNFGDHEALLTDDAVTAGSGVGVRWYELRMNSGSTPTVYQQGTYAPDSTYRWMGSIAMDKAGSIALGYSQSSSSVHPSIRFTGRAAGDALGTMTQAETTIVTGAGSQTSYSRWGDYTSMSVDPSDDCTFFYTDEYEPSTGNFNWQTRIASFQLPNCTVTSDFSMSANPSSGSVVQGNSATSTISTAATGGDTESITLSASGLPSGATAGFSPASVTAGGSSTLTIATAASTPAGTYPITVTGTGGAHTHTTSYSLTVTPPVTNDFSISVSPTSGSVTQGSSATTSVSTAVASGTAQTVTFSATGVPTGATATFNPASATAGSGSTLTIATSASTPAGNYTVNVVGTYPGGSPTHSTPFTLTVTPPSTGGITNGGFETGDFTGWTTSGPSATVVNSGAHSGTYAARLGTTTPTNGDSNAAQTFTAPSGAGTLSFWYNVTCPDTVTYDWATATLKDNTANTTTTMLAKTCVSSSGWKQASTAVTAGHSYTLTLTSHDDNYSGDPTYTLFDDVALATAAPNPIVNGGFETGSLSGWTATGASETVVNSGAHSGTYAARLGTTTPTNGDSSIAQTFTATGGGTLSFYYNLTCPDTVTYDWATATLKDNTANTTTTVLAKTCVSSSGWTPVSAALTAGHSYTLTLTSHDDNYSGDPTYTLYDDVSVS